MWQKHPERDDFMQNGKRAGKIGMILPLLLMYAGCVLIRYLLAQLTTNYPTVYIDEFLYYSLGRSIATEGSLLYYGQPAAYNYIAYPLVIAPIYKLFGHGTDYYRMIQLWNFILMSLSIFPIYGLIHAMTQKRKTALWLTGMVMLLPDFALGQFIFSEAIIYPMFYSLMYCVFRNLKESKIKYTIWIGVLGALLYWSKPGALVPAVAALLLFAGKSALARNGKSAIHVLAGAAGFAAVFFAMKLIADQVLGYHGSLFSIYDIQINYQNDLNLERFWRAMALYPYYFILAGGVLPVMVSLWRMPEYSREEKQYYLLQVVSVVVTLIGIAWIINRPEEKEILYLRYTAMYLPLFFVCSVLPAKEERPALPARKVRISEVIACVLLGYIVLCTVIWGSTTGIGKAHDTHFLISLSVLFTPRIAGIANILVIALTIVTLYLLARKTDRKLMNRICCGLFGCFMILNNVMGYLDTADNSNVRWANETKEIHRILGDREYLHVCAEDQCDYGLDIRSRRNISRIPFSDFYGNTRVNGGTYVPFVPSTMRGMAGSVFETPDTETLIVDENVHQAIKFRSDLEQFISEGNSFQVVRFPRGERIVDSFLLYQKYPTVYAGSSVTLRVYNPEWLSRQDTLRLDIESGTEQEMTFGAGEQYSIPLSEGRHWYEVTIVQPVDEYVFGVLESDIAVYGYEFVPAGQGE